jgi:putative ABC transport system permease protein
MGGITRDLRYAVRSLLQDRASVALAFLALSLGIGATTVIFSVVYSVFVAAFPFRDQSRVVHFFPHSAQSREGSWWYIAPEFLDYKAQNHVFSDVLGGASMEVLYNHDNSTYRVRGALIDPRAFPVLGLKMQLGREVTDADGAREAPPTFLMSDRLWSSAFNRDPKIIGATLKLNGTIRTLIGITPPRFQLHNADVFFPTTITADLTDSLVGGSGQNPLAVWTYARLKDGVTLEQAAADLEIIARRQQQIYPNEYPKGDLKVTVISLADAYTAQRLQELVWILVGAVLMLLLIACSNVANLLLARATARETELAVRASLGASRWRLMQQLLAESFVLAAAGTAVGALMAYAGLQWVRATIPTNALPAEMSIRFSGQTFAATIGVAVLTAVICGLAPALRAGRSDLQARLAGTRKGVGLGAGRGRLRTLLVAVQVTLTIVLLVGAGLMMRSLMALHRVDLGLNPTNVLTGRFAFPVDQRRTPAERAVFIQQVLQNVGTLPGVVAATPTAGIPVQGGPSVAVAIPGAVLPERPMTMLEPVSDSYFRTLGVPLVLGRLLSDADVSSGRRVAVVNRTFVQQFLNGGDALSRTVAFGRVDPNKPVLFEIVGVVGDSRNSGWEGPIRPQAFVPYTAGGPVSPGGILVRTSVAPMTLAHTVREQIWAVDRGVALMNADPLEAVLHRAYMAAPTFGFGLMSTFAAVGLILAAIGVFSVMAYTVSLQTHEIGIRMALGAEPRGVMRMIVLRGLRPIVAGVVVGVIASYYLTRVLSNQIYGIGVTDPWTFAGVVVGLAAIALAACVLPARRAMLVDPLIALRAE